MTDQHSHDVELLLPAPHHRTPAIVHRLINWKIARNEREANAFLLILAAVSFSFSLILFALNSQQVTPEVQARTTGIYNPQAAQAQMGK